MLVVYICQATIYCIVECQLAIPALIDYLKLPVIFETLGKALKHYPKAKRLGKQFSFNPTALINLT